MRGGAAAPEGRRLVPVAGELLGIAAEAGRQSACWVQTPKPDCRISGPTQLAPPGRPPVGCLPCLAQISGPSNTGTICSQDLGRWRSVEECARCHDVALLYNALHGVAGARLEQLGEVGGGILFVIIVRLFTESVFLTTDHARTEPQTST